MASASGKEGRNGPVRGHRRKNPVWKEVKSVYAELAVPLGTMLNCEAFERRLDERL
jgi:hypothetical protein